MATKKHTVNKLALTLWMATFVVMPNVSSAAPGTLASVPLFTASNADPNIMFHLDTSGSMNHVMVESEYGGVATYDDSVTYDADPDDGILDTCSDAGLGGGLIPNTDDVYLDISSGNPKISFIEGGGGTLYDLGNDAAETEKCFDPTKKYNARLTTYRTLPLTLSYSGNYLNWYFNKTTTTGDWTTTTNNIKPKTRNRYDVAEDSLENLINSLSNVRVGASTFDSDTGASIDEEIDDISSGSQRQNTIDAFDRPSGPAGVTPLAESLRDIGRYFSNATTTTGTNYECGGASSTNLTIHPDAATSPPRDDIACATLLGNKNTIKNKKGPIEYQCQSNFVIMTTDGAPADDQDINSNLTDYDDDCDTIPVDGSGTALYDCSAGFDMKSAGAGTYTYTTNDSSDYLDDVAQALFEMDLRPDLDDDAGNEVTNNIRTYVVGFADDSVANNQLLIDTADQGGGDFIYAEDANELETAFNDATSAILNLIGSAAAVTFNTATLGANSAVYLALFNSSSWSGDLVAYDLNDTTGAIGSQTWSAAASLDALTDANAVANRVILTYNGSAGIPFRWPADHTTPDASTELDSGQINDLLTGATGGATDPQKDVLGQAVVDFIRGDTSIEGTTVTGKNFRNRTSRLGDIVHAGPVFVGAPEVDWPDGTGNTIDFPDGDNAYSLYKLNSSSDAIPGRADRPGVVYVGSNDGMLHGFATNTAGSWTAGQEVFAYAPRSLFTTASSRGFHYLTDNSYNHQYYVDLIPTVSDVYYAGDGWKTILVGGLRGGARGIYALDVTDPASFSESGTAPDDIVLGEFTNAIEADLGYTFSRPTIAKMENGRWAIIMGNGYNLDMTATGTATGAATGKASLIIIYLTGGGNIADGWDEGSAATDDYLKISTGVGGLTAATLNGLSTPTLIDADGNGMVDRAYAGDLMGNMWAFDLTDTTSPVSWDVAYSSGGGATPVPLFAGTDDQPITSQPEVVLNPEVATAPANKPNVLVLFGTGQYVSSADNAYTVSTPLGDQTFYGIWDAGTSGLVKADLTEQTIDTETGGLRTISSNAVGYAESGGSKNFGWYIDFDTNSDGERMVTDPVVRGDIVYFNTSIPSATTCSYGGDGWQMSVQYKSGANPGASIFDADGDGQVSDDDPYSGVAFTQGLPAAPSFLSDRRYTPGTQTQTGSEVADDAVEEIGGMGTGRLSWEELFR